MPVRFERVRPARPLIHIPGDSPFLPPGNQWNARGEPVPDEEKVPAPERMFDGAGRLVYAAGALASQAELDRLVPESRLHQNGEVFLTVQSPEPEPDSVKPTKAKTRARKPGENRSG